MIYDRPSSDDHLMVLTNCTRWRTAQATLPTGVARVIGIVRLQFPLILQARGWTKVGQTETYCEITSEPSVSQTDE